MDPDSARQVRKSRDTPTPGSLVADKYRILRTLGEGGMGVVVEARHVHLDQRVAIKFLRGPQADDANNVMRFQREARAAAKVKSDHVAQIYDVGMLDDGTRYLVMEYLEGCDLADEIARNGRLPVEHACGIAVQLLDAISRAHEVGIVHRDLKPENIFLVHQADGSRRVKVVDFGISKLDDTKGALKLTGTSDLMGTPLYMAPEQMATPELVDGRADIWSIGCVLYEMLSGQRPFDAESMPEICTRVMSQDPRHLCDVASDIPPGLGETVMRCLLRDVAARMPSAAELSALLHPYVSATSVVSRSFISGISPISVRTMGANTGGFRDRTQTLGDVDFTPKRTRFLPWLAGILLMVAGLLGAAAMGFLPVPWQGMFLGAAEGAAEVPAVGAAQAAESTSMGVKEAEGDAGADANAETPAGELGIPPGGEKGAAPSEGAAPSALSEGAAPKKQPRRPATVPLRSTVPASSSEQRKPTVAAPYEEFAEFGGRR